jgi:hypothetical protein
VRRFHLLGVVRGADRPANSKLGWIRCRSIASAADRDEPAGEARRAAALLQRLRRPCGRSDACSGDDAARASGHRRQLHAEGRARDSANESIESGNEGRAREVVRNGWGARWDRAVVVPMPSPCRRSGHAALRAPELARLGVLPPNGPTATGSANRDGGFVKPP